MNLNQPTRRLPVKKMLKIILALIGIGVLAYAGLFAYVCVAENTVPAPGETDVIIVLGAQVKPDGTPSVQLEYRLEKALEAYLEQPQVIVCCGGRAGQEPEAEGTVMRAWLIAHGVAEGDALAETSSGNTKENIRNALAMLPFTPKKALIVTSDYHLPRAMAIARDFGLDVSGAAATTLPEYWLKNHARETLSWGKYLLEKILGR